MAERRIQVLKAALKIIGGYLRSSPDAARNPIRESTQEHSTKNQELLCAVFPRFEFASPIEDDAETSDACLLKGFYHQKVLAVASDIVARYPADSVISDEQGGRLSDDSKWIHPH